MPRRTVNPAGPAAPFTSRTKVEPLERCGPAEDYLKACGSSGES